MMKSQVKSVRVSLPLCFVPGSAELVAGSREGRGISAFYEILDFGIDK
jgi:hypothetical protein